MIKYLKILCLLCLLLFVGLGFYGKNKFEAIDYHLMAKDKYYIVDQYQDFLKIFPDTAKELIDDMKVTCLDDMIKQSDFVLKIKNGKDKIIQGHGLINQCQVLKVFKGKNMQVNESIFIYDFADSIISDSIGYVEGSKPLVPNQEYIVFCKKAPTPNMKNSYIFSSINYGFFAVESQGQYIENYENGFMFLEDTYQYDYIGTNKQFLKTYQQIAHEISQKQESLN